MKGSGVVFTHGEGISTQHVRPKGRQPLIECAKWFGYHTIHTHIDVLYAFFVLVLRVLLGHDLIQLIEVDDDSPNKDIYLNNIF